MTGGEKGSAGAGVADREGRGEAEAVGELGSARSRQALDVLGSWGAGATRPSRPYALAQYQAQWGWEEEKGEGQ